MRVLTRRVFLGREFIERNIVQPQDSVRHTLTGGTFYKADLFCRKGFRGEGIVVGIEAAGESPTAVENESADDGSGGVACLLEGLSDGAKLRRQRLPGEILHAVLKWISAGQDSGVRRPGKRDLRDGALENQSVARERIKGGSLDGLRAVASDVIGTQSVDGDENHVRFGGAE